MVADLDPLGITTSAPQEIGSTKRRANENVTRKYFNFGKDNISSSVYFLFVYLSFIIHCIILKIFYLWRIFVLFFREILICGVVQSTIHTQKQEFRQPLVISFIEFRRLGTLKFGALFLLFYQYIREIASCIESLKI